MGARLYHLEREADRVLSVASDARVSTEALAQASGVIADATLGAHVEVSDVVVGEGKDDVTVSRVPCAVGLDVVNDNERAVFEDSGGTVGHGIVVRGEGSGSNVDALKHVFHTVDVAGRSVPSLDLECVLLAGVAHLDERAHARHVVGGAVGNTTVAVIRDDLKVEAEVKGVDVHRLASVTAVGVVSASASGVSVRCVELVAGRPHVMPVDGVHGESGKGVVYGLGVALDIGNRGVGGGVAGASRATGHVVDSQQLGDPFVVELVGEGKGVVHSRGLVLQELESISLGGGPTVEVAVPVDTLDRVGHDLSVLDGVSAARAFAHRAGRAGETSVAHALGGLVQIPGRVLLVVIAVAERTAHTVAAAVVGAHRAVAALTPVAREAVALPAGAVADALVGAFTVEVSFVPVFRARGTRVTVAVVKKLTATTNDVADAVHFNVLSGNERSVRVVGTVAVKVTSGTVDEGAAESADAVAAISAHPVAVALALRGAAHSVATAVVRAGSGSKADAGRHGDESELHDCERAFRGK